MELKEYRSIPFWSWNDKLELTRLKDQIHWMKENGIGGFFMHARSGLQTEYLSEEWMQCIEGCAGEAQELGMKAWIYDENGWPSGFVGGKLLEDEKNRDKYLETKMGAYDAQADVSYLLTEDELVRVSGGTEEASTVPEGEYLNLYIHIAASTVDILNPEVVEQFLTLTHEAYKARFGESFSEKIEGFFTDEPQYYRWATPYTDMIAAYWEKEYGEDILDGLGLLFVEKKGYRSFRYRYWKAMQSLMLHNFAEKIYSWCEKNGVKLTGHYVEEVTLGFQVMCCGGVMPFYEYEHIPGIDWLGKDTCSELAVRQVGSVAAQLGKKRVITETFGCCGWDVSIQDLRRIAGFQYVNGVNMMCHHLVPYSERGSRKYDYPAHYSRVNPWVREEFKTFNDYYTRLGHLLGEGESHVNVAMLHPIRSVYFDYKREKQEEGFGVADLDHQLLKACKTLASHGIEYHFLDETLLEKYGFVNGTQIGCGQCAYDYLVLPSIVTMDKTTEELLRTFVENGGRVLLLGEKPTFLEAEEYAYTYLESNVTLEEICAAQPYQVKHFETEIYSTYRRFEGKEFLYVMNSSVENTYTQSFACGEAAASFVKVDLLEDATGACLSGGKKIPLTITLKPGEDALLCFDGEEVPEKKDQPSYTLRFENAGVSVKENYLPVDSIRYSLDGGFYSKPWPCAALFQKLLKEQYEGKIFFRYEFEVEKIPEKLYLRTEKSRDLAVWLNGKELTKTVPSEEDYVNTYDVTDLVRMGTNAYTVKVDWFESEDVYYALFGENVTESLKNCIVYDTELQPIELVGPFGVYSKKGYVQDEDPRFVRGEEFYIGSLPETIKEEPVTEGFPFLAGEMILSQKVILETDDICMQVPGDYQLAAVKVNGADVGKLFFEREVDLTGVAKAGENEVQVRFVLSNRNRMGPHHLECGKNESVSPWSFELNGTWEEDQSAFYHNNYDIKKFYES